MSVHSTVCSLDCCKLPEALLFSASFMLLEFTGPCHCSDLGKTETSSSDRPTKKTQFWTLALNLFFSQGRTPPNEGFSPTCSMLSWGGEYSKWVHACVNHLFCSQYPHPSTLYCQHEIQARKKPVLWAALQNVWTWDKCSSLLSLSRVKPEAKRFLPITLHWAGKRNYD